ncbi:MAG: hypothetical protein RLZZ127_524, partial [Planctomycetota bacterium]
MNIHRSVPLLALHALLAAADPSAATVAEAWPADAGLAVQVGAGSAAFLDGLTGKTRGRLVHGLVRGDELRDRLRGELHQRKLHPLATVATWHGSPGLPYADRLVNLLIIDRDDLGAAAPSSEEARRVVAPGGAVLERRGGAWSVQRIERPATFGDWTHVDADAAGSSVGNDREMTGIRSWQWMDNFRELPWEKTGPHGGHEGNIRIWGGYAVWDYDQLGKDMSQSSRVKGRFPDVHAIVCRDVSNGLPVWRRDGAGGTRGSRRGLAVDHGLVFTWLKDGGPLTALDIRDGSEVRAYPGSEIKPWTYDDRGKPQQRTSPHGDSHWVRVTSDTVLANGDGTLRAWTIAGKPLWSFARAGLRVELPVVDAASATAYALLVADEPIGSGRSGPVYWGRWPSSYNVKSLVALDLATGQPRWENTDIASRDLGMFDTKTKWQVTSGFGQVLIAGDHVVLQGNASISGGRAALLASVDRRTGRTAAFDPKTLIRNIRKDGEIEWHGFLYQAIWRDGRVLLMGSSRIFGWDPASNALEPLFDLPWNARCVRPVATAEHVFLGQTALIGRDFSGTMVAVARSGCAQSPTPAAGLLFFGPHMCACTTHFDGFLAMSPRPVPAPVAEGERLLRPKTASVPAPAAVDPPVSPVAALWSGFTISAEMKPATVEGDGWKLIIDPVRQRVDAAGPGGTSWAWVGDARLGTAAVI